MNFYMNVFTGSVDEQDNWECDAEESIGTDMEWCFSTEVENKTLVEVKLENGDWVEI